MKTLFFILLAAIIQLSCTNRDVVEKSRSLEPVLKEIKTIDPKAEDYSDLQFLKKIIDRDSIQVILLGEQTHGDGSTFLAKSRLIKFLHKEAGFDVLAFESGLFDCTNAWGDIQRTGNYTEGIRKAVFPMWVNSNECEELVQYLQSTLQSGRPLELSGFDSQLTGYESCQLLLDQLYKYELNFLTQGEKNLFVKLVCLNEEIKSGRDRTYNNILIDKVINSLDSLSKTDEKFEFWKLVIEGVKLNYNGYLAMKYETVNHNDAGLINARDQQMGKNLLWLAQNKFKGKKIIVWAASFHNSRNLSSILGKEADSSFINNLYKKTKTMGDAVYNELGKKMYSIVFTGYGGSSRNIQKYDETEVTNASENSLEYILEYCGKENSYIDLRDPSNPGWLSENFIMRPLGNKEMEGKWSNSADGIFYIKNMKPSTFGNEK
ncbi:MAG: erythromycin esterase family protein [Ignavibacteriales bacterium]|nr:erythromycin esterase family protein [Ignavibacteriales bacterium]